MIRLTHRPAHGREPIALRCSIAAGQYLYLRRHADYCGCSPSSTFPVSATVIGVPKSTTPPEALLRSVAFVVSDLHRVGRAQLDAALADEGFTLRMHWILACLKQEGELTQRQVCDVLAVDRSDMVRLVDGLEKRGFVVRRKDAKDRRKHLLTLTEDGEKAVARTQDLVEGTTDRLFADLSAKDRRTLHRLALRALGHPKKYADTDV